MARIAIDARKLGDFGIGSYLEVLLAGLSSDPGAHEYLVFVDERRAPSLPEGPFERVALRAGAYGVLEHLELPARSWRLGAQLLHCPHYVLPLGRRGPSIVTIHDLIHLRFPAYLPNRLALRYARAMIGSAWRRARTVVAVSEFTRADLVHEFGEREEVHVVPNGVGAAFFEAPDEARDLRLLAGLGLASLEGAGARRDFVLLPGNLKAHKNHAGLLRAFARLRGHEQCLLVLTGNALEAYDPLRGLARELGIEERLRCLGWLSSSELRACYRGCALLAFPSFYEGFGLPVAEALVCGAAVVCSDRSALPEVCGGAALLFDPAQQDALVAALEAVLGDEQRAGELRRLARGCAERFRPERQSAATRALYERTLAL